MEALIEVKFQSSMKLNRSFTATSFSSSLRSSNFSSLLSVASPPASSFPASSTPLPSLLLSSRLFCFRPVCLNQSSNRPAVVAVDEVSRLNYNVAVGSPIYPPFLVLKRLSFSDQALSLLAFIFCTTAVAFTSLVIAAVPTLHAMARAAIALSKLADTAREELPGTMAAVRLSGMELSDLTLELSDLSKEIADGVHKSAQAVQAAEAGIRQLGSLARDQTASMIRERANLPTISLQPAVVGAAKKTSRAVGRATKSIFNMISNGEFKPGGKDDSAIDRIEI